MADITKALKLLHLEQQMQEIQNEVDMDIKNMSAEQHATLQAELDSLLNVPQMAKLVRYQNA